MKAILPPAKIFIKLIGKQKTKTSAHRLLHYCVLQPVEEGTLVFNLLTRAMMLLTPEEMEHVTELPEMRAQWYAVPIDHDDRKFALQVRSLSKIQHPDAGYYSHYTIYPTTDCNARCFYCFEKGCKKSDMSEETAQKVVEMIAKNWKMLVAAEGENTKKKIVLDWFGGEPLYKSSIIDYICCELQKHGIPYKSKMTSNGYLFDEEMVERADSLWHLSKIQITLDGTQEVYNRCKNYIYKDVDAYGRVMENIGRLLKRGMTVHIRLNIDLHNAENLILLAKELKERFQNEDRLHVYSHTLFEEGCIGYHTKNEEHRIKLFEKQEELDNLLFKSGISKPGSLSEKIKINHCKADSDNSITILPNGELGLCEHYSENHFIGHIDKEERDQNEINAFRQLRPEQEACETCPLYPDCFRLELCENSEHCYPETVKHRLAGIRRSMICDYEYYKNPS